MDDERDAEATRQMGIQADAIVSGAGEGLARLVVLMGPEPGRRYTMGGSGCVVGRAEDCDVQLDDSKISRRHIRIRASNGRWLAEDLRSRNGTLVNGEALEAARELKVGDRLQLSAETVLLFTRQDPLEDLLVHRQQMEVIGHLAAGIAHDFNNLLNVVEASTTQLRKLDPATPLGDPMVAECHADIRAAGRRAAELTTRLLAIAGRRAKPDEASEPAVIDLSALTSDILHVVRRTFGATIEVEAHVTSGLSVSGDRSALHQVLMNLCLNARDAMPDGGTLRVRATHDPEKERVVVWISDTGVGMDERTRARVFEPFFTTKPREPGSGLGLATVFEVVSRHGGSVEVESSPGAGSTFVVSLPAVSSAPPSARPSIDRRASTWDGRVAPRDVARVLVVDDQELVRRSLGRLIAAYGHDVTLAADGLEAVEQYQAASPPPDLVLMDLDMPRLSGEEALVQILAFDPSARIVLISGFNDESHRRHLIRQGAIDLLGKPVDANDILECIRTALVTPAEPR
ncbi:MAG: response regulator [Sandaracinaceae bacterium]|nr:response regulator [Sandaracinaceae bacterium]